MRKIGLNIAYVIILLLLMLPSVQMKFHIFKEKQLNGAFQLTEKPSFTKEKWNSGQFQEQVESYLKDYSGFRNFMVRLQNQLDFFLFRQANAEGVVVGKNKQLFEYDYIRSWLALDFPGESFIEKKLQRTKYVQQFLKQEKGIDLVVVFEPGKASFFPEYLPSSYSLKKAGPSTYDRYLSKAKELNIDFIDLHQYFLQLKPHSEYPLFPRSGTHWSVYGMQFAADSILNLIEKRRGITLTEARVDTLEISSKPRDTDDDVIKTMNLLFPLRGEKLAYPVYSFDTANPGERPMVLVVADSYYWNIYNTGMPKYLFANEAFWYFNTLVYPDNYIQPVYTNELDLRQEVEKQQVIFLMVTERFLHKFDWTFIDRLYTLYTPVWLKDPVYNKINDIMQVASWYENMIDKAELKTLTLEEVLINEAKFLHHMDDTLTYMVNYGPEHFRNIIENDPEWMAYVREKAVKEKVSTEEMLNVNALYSFSQNSPGLYKLNRGMTAMKEWIYSDTAMYETLKREAAVYHFDETAFISIKAMQLYRDEEINKSSQTIRKDHAWLESVKQKAAKKGISVDEMIRLDAEYIWEQGLKKSLVTGH